MCNSTTHWCYGEPDQLRNKLYISFVPVNQGGNVANQKLSNAYRYGHEQQLLYAKQFKTVNILAQQQE